MEKNYDYERFLGAEDKYARTYAFSWGSGLYGSLRRKLFLKFNPLPKLQDYPLTK